MTEKIPKNEPTLEALQHQLAIEIENHRKTRIKLRMREHENHSITQSRSYKMARVLAGGLQLTRIAVGHTKALNPKRIVMIQRNKQHVYKMYGAPSFTEAFEAQPAAKLAVIIHLYYTDMLPLFVERLSVLENVEYDLYLTVPEKNAAQLQELQTIAPTARIALVPNCGRDVLPFVQALKQLSGKGYEYVLKLHSKKSPHRSDGAEWRDRMLDNLLPKDGRVLMEIMETLSKKDTALVGPTDEYVSLLVNFSATFNHLKRIVRETSGQKVLEHVLRHPDEYGFFGGTMFWARVDALTPIIDAVQLKDFEPELGQEDSTLAHALERAFNLVPQLQTKKLYEASTNQVVERPYETTNIPSWAEYSIDD